MRLERERLRGGEDLQEEGQLRVVALRDGAAERVSGVLGDPLVEAAAGREHARRRERVRPHPELGLRGSGRRHPEQRGDRGSRTPGVRLNRVLEQEHGALLRLISARRSGDRPGPRRPLARGAPGRPGSLTHGRGREAGQPLLRDARVAPCPELRGRAAAPPARPGGDLSARLRGRARAVPGAARRARAAPRSAVPRPAAVPRRAEPLPRALLGPAAPRASACAGSRSRSSSSSACPTPGRSALTVGIWLLLWALYLSIVNVGQTFYSFGWESLLLEAGFLAGVPRPRVDRGARADRLALPVDPLPRRVRRRADQDARRPLLARPHLPRLPPPDAADAEPALLVLPPAAEADAPDGDAREPLRPARRPRPALPAPADRDLRGPGDDRHPGVARAQRQLRVAERDHPAPRRLCDRRPRVRASSSRSPTSRPPAGSGSTGSCSR